MGSADVVPGVSGGTVAYILGIYPRLLAAITGFGPRWAGWLLRGKFPQAWQHVDGGFLLLLGSGIIAAVLFFTRVVPIPVLLTTHPQQVYGLFFGLIAGSLLVLARRLGRHGGVDLCWLLVGIAFGLVLVNLVPLQIPHTSVYVFLSGVVAITAMILPGLSGSFILLILHQYAYVMDAIGVLRFGVILPFAGGCLVGLMLFARVLRWLLGTFPRVTSLVINGLLIGSLWAVWPFQHRQYISVRGKERLISSQPVLPDTLDATVLTAAGLIVLGVLVVVGLERFARRKFE